MLVAPDKLKQRIGLLLTFVFMKDCRIVHILWTASEVVKVSSCWARQYDSHLGDHNNNNQSSNSTINSDGNWVYLSTDGVVAKNSGYVATGGVAYDQDGNWIVGFNRFLGVCSPFEAKIWGILDGILILLNKGYGRIIIMTDNLKVA
ncbi:putative LRR receptor-like serine/threonine-protein kinase [Gossypium australe]|uniref:Putative LRR receptor-like serine/threonine-protein kinase n=1 Tax=Gossypium australe TaxID=47621 RepID=A0A5B6VTU9_9ROSI|nr:putative LRR receptor-like serine/threonine-protein kinase [Gossypium australe]